MKPFLIVLLVTQLGATAIWAEGARPRDSGGPRDEQVRERKKTPGGGFGEMLAKLDQNADRAVSLGEFSAGERVKNLPEEYREKLFKRLDKDEDGLLTKADMPTVERPGKSHRRPVDLNNDKKVTFEEFQKSGKISQLPAERQRALFDRMDRNHDGILNGKDWRREGERQGGANMHRSQVDLDANKDGKISFKEFRRHPRHAELSEDEQEDRFEALDKDGNGFLEESERPPGPPKGEGPPARPGEKKGDRPAPPRGPKA